MRGSLHALHTRIYFSDELNDNDVCCVQARRQTLIAERKEINGIINYHFDIHIQGEKETVFFQV